MSTSSPPATDSSSASCGGLSRWSALLATCLVLLVTSWVRAPIPAVNEPHYLGKARYWWDPTWCAGDFFLASSNPHLVFYVAIGWLTRWLTLEQTAIVGRIVSLALVATGWQRLGRALFVSPWTATAAAALLALLSAIGNFSGEWLIGGVESKVFAYGFVVWAGTLWLEGRPLLSAFCAGAAVSFHPLVGGWSVVAAILGAGLRWIGNRAQRPSVDAAGERTSAAVDGGERLSVAWAILMIGIFLIASLPGLVPALEVAAGGDRELMREADRIVVTQRVGHHTDPLLFPRSAYLHYAVLLAVWGVLCGLSGRERGVAALRRFIAGSLVIAAAGLVVGWWPRVSSVDVLAPWRLWFLKFYPFRLADLALPAGVALLGARLIEWPFRSTVRRTGIVVSSATVAVIALTGAWSLPAPDANASGMSAADRADWIELCHWLRDATPPGAIIGTANEDWAVKWFADRPEYVTFKDCPQDPAGILEWWRRRRWLVSWSKRVRQDGLLSADDLRELRSETGIQYLVVSRYGPFDIEPVHQQGKFRVYRLPE